MSRQLTPNSSLDNFKKEAKRWLKALRANDEQARARLVRSYPAAPAEPGLRDIQHALALEHGLTGWTDLKNQLAAGAPIDTSHAELVDSFLKNASLDWRVGGSMRISLRHTAERLLRRHPEIARDSIYTAVVCGDLEEVERILAERPEATSAIGGPREWPPLLYLCSTRLSLPTKNDNAVAIARALLDRGADPNAYYYGGSESIHYTALACVAGEGEEDAPPHLQREALWQLLLERGAEPYDIQTLYNTHFHGDVLWFLELMYTQAVKLGRQADWDDPNWSMLDMGGYGCGARYLLGIAVGKNNIELAEWLLAHGAGPNADPPPDPRWPKRSLHEDALRLGQAEMAELLVRYGASPSVVVFEGVEAFAAACFRLDRREAEALLEEHPEYLLSPVTMFAAAKRDRADVVAFLLELGMSVDVEDDQGTRGLHEAAYADASRAVALLLERGAEVDPRDSRHGNTPLGWAVYGKKQRTIELLSPVSRDVFKLVWIGAVERVREVLSEEPDLAKIVSDGGTMLMWLPDDEARAMEIAGLLLDHGADSSIRNSEGEMAADRARKRGLDDVADMLDSATPVPAPSPPARPSLQQHEKLAEDLLEAYRSGDSGAMQRLKEQTQRTFTWDELRAGVQQNLGKLPDSENRRVDISLADAQLLLARWHGVEGWKALTERVAASPRASSTSSTIRGAIVSTVASVRAALSRSPMVQEPYDIDWMNNTIRLRRRLSEKDADAVIGLMKETQIPALNADGQMTDAVLERIAGLDFVTRLDLGGSKRLTDDGLKHLARMPRLQDLDLSEYPGGRITDRGLEVLRHLPELRRFQMCWQRGITDIGVANLSFCDHLESVDLMGTQTGDGAIKALTGKRELRRFKTGSRVTDAGLPLLHQFPVFKTWHGGDIKYSLMSPDAEPNHLLVDGPFTDEGLASLAGLDGLFGLSLFWHVSALTAEGLKPLADLPNLGFLGCEGKLCNDEAMRHIAAMPRLRMLMAQGTVAGDAGFAALSRSQTIEYIWGRECPNLGGRGFAALATIPALRGLAVSCKNVDDQGLSALPRFSALKELMPMDVPDDGFRYVGRCEQLESLVLMYCQETTDLATEHIAGLSRLKKYFASYTKITDHSMEILSRITSLERIEFYGCPGVTNAGVTALAGLPRLCEVEISGPQITRECAAAFPASVRVEIGV